MKRRLFWLRLQSVTSTIHPALESLKLNIAFTALWQSVFVIKKFLPQVPAGLRVPYLGERAFKSIADDHFLVIVIAAGDDISITVNIDHKPGHCAWSADADSLERSGFICVPSVLRLCRNDELVIQSSPPQVGLAVLTLNLSTFNFRATLRMSASSFSLLFISTMRRLTSVVGMKFFLQSQNVVKSGQGLGEIAAAAIKFITVLFERINGDNERC